MNNSETIKTGFPKLDLKLMGLHPGEVILMASRPGAGKTTIASQVAEHVALNCGLSVLYFSLGWDHSVVDRILFRMAKVWRAYPVFNWQRDSFYNKDRDKILSAEKKLNQSPLAIVEEYEADYKYIEKHAMWLKEKKGLNFIVVDFLEQTKHPVANLRKLKALAKKINVCILVLSSLPRRIENRKVKIPVLSDLRYSAKMESIADFILLLYCVNPDKKYPFEKVIFKLIIAKNASNNEKGTIKLVTNDSRGFEEYPD